MTIRDFEPQDRTTILEMVDTFYHSPGVLHKIPTQNFARVFDEMCNGGSHRLRGLLIEIDNKPAGYCALSFSYSAEADGTVVLIEELFIAPDFRGQGLGHETFSFLKKEYHGKAARLRLEVAPENNRAKALYEKMGFEVLPYIQMINDVF